MRIKKILVSKIFDWYSQDFAPKNGSTFEKMSPWLSSDLKSKLKVRITNYGSMITIGILMIQVKSISKPEHINR